MRAATFTRVLVKAIETCSEVRVMNGKIITIVAVGILLSAGLVLTAIVRAPAPAAAAMTSATIEIDNMTFSPSSLTVKKGTTVVWKNFDSVPHTSTSDTGLWDSGNIPPNGTFSGRASKRGTFPYHCKLHPSMQATIIVK